MRIVLFNIPKQTLGQSEHTAIDIPPPPTIKDLARQEMRIKRNPDLDKRISCIFDNFIFFCLASIAAYYISLENEET
jgi:hypothetical protein